MKQEADSGCFRAATRCTTSNERMKRGDAGEIMSRIRRILGFYGKAGSRAWFGSEQRAARRLAMDSMRCKGGRVTWPFPNTFEWTISSTIARTDVWQGPDDNNNRGSRTP